MACCLHIGVEKGKTAAVDSVLAVLGKKGEDISKLLAERLLRRQSGKQEKAPEPGEGGAVRYGASVRRSTTAPAA